MSRLPAVVIIVFNRPEKTRIVLEQVLEAKPSKLFVIADGPRDDHPNDSFLVDKTRALFAGSFENIEVVRLYSEVNLGLRQRVLSGLDEVFNAEDSAIILEDDCLPHQDFFQFASELLQRYEGNAAVGLISANNFAPNPRMKTSYYFSTHPRIWGWATWRSTWSEFRSEPPPMPLGNEHRQIIKSRLPGTFRSRGFLRLTENAARLDSWAIQFAVSCHLTNKLIVVPKVNLVKNIGFGRDSTHTKFESYANEVDIQPLAFPLHHPSHVSVSFANMRRESCLKSFRWIMFPLAHPLNFLMRLLRYSKVVFHLAPKD